MPRSPVYRSAITAATLAFLVASYLFAPRIPRQAGWENGPIENFQVGLLIAGGLLALRYGQTLEPDARRTFWRLMAPIWFMLAARELSWGACFLPPYAMAQDTGPKFSSSVQLWYRPAIPYLLVSLLGMLLWRFIRSGQLSFLSALRRQRGLPLVEAACAMACMLASGAAEGHLHVDLGFPAHWASQNLEELSETWAYGLVLMAQWRVFRSSTVRRH